MEFRFRPRFGGIAALVVIASVALLAAALLAGLQGITRTLAVVGGGTGIGLALLYSFSPAWRLTVHVDDEALEVKTRGDRRFRLPWTEVKRVVASAETHTCFVDGGEPSRSLLVPGPGASAPYDIENKAELYEAILARVPADIVEHVDLLETAAAAERADSDSDSDSEAKS